ncbi:MAG: serine/threonine-protein kinase [Acidobacteria bacterium]|jgi:serine/threonine protein kinase|nr:serine/threonine-protein kinase [Acidobacteriota bacterium]
MMSLFASATKILAKTNGDTNNMAHENWRQVKEIFADVLRQKPEVRRQFLNEVCGDDATRREVESLLSSFDEAESFMENPAVGEVAELLVAENSQLTNGQNLGRYEIIRQIGAGGMGEVYLAQDTRLNRKVALKVLSAELTNNKMLLARFEQEARSASALNHPNIITIHEIGKDRDIHFIATEFIKGITLRQQIGGRHLETAKALDVAMQIASALAVAHEAGIVHRDIKPENVMLREDGLVKVLDFGLAKLSEEKITDPFVSSEALTPTQVQTNPGMVMGTVAYMSPEQARGLPVDARTDIFSLGVVFYEMLTGTQPFAGETTSDVIAAILRSEPQPLSIHVPNASVELEHIVKKALGKDREERYQVVKDLLLDLKILQRESNYTAEISSAESISNAEESAAKTQIVMPLKTENFLPKNNWLWFALPALVLLVIVSANYLWPPGEAEKIFLGSLDSSPIRSWNSEFGEGDLSRARFSPDGKFIAYGASKNGKKAISLIQIGGGEPLLHKQEDSDDWSPIFSPDGGKIAYCSERVTQSGIWEIPVLGGSPVLLAQLDTRCQGLIHWDKEEIIYFEMTNNLYALNIASKQITQLTYLDTSQLGQRDFNFAPNEKRIVYADRKDGQSDLWIADKNGGNPKRLTNDAVEDSRPVWHADGKRIIYSSDHNGVKQIWLAFLDRRRPVQMITSDFDSYVADVSSDGTKILYETTRDAYHLWGIPLEDRKEFKLTSGIGAEFWQDVAPNGEKIAYQSACRSSVGGNLLQCSIWSQKITNSDQKFKMSADGFNPRWSPDGSHLAFLRSEAAGNNSLWITSAAGGDERKLTDGGIVFGGLSLIPFNHLETQDYQWSPDSRSLIYCANRGGVSNVWKAEADGTADGADETQLTKNEDKSLLFFNPLFSPDGGRIAWLSMLPGKQRKTNRGIWIFEDGAARQIYPSESVLGLVGWSQSGNELIVKSAKGRIATSLPVEVSLFGLALDGSAPRSIAKLKETFFQNIQLSPDRKTLAFVTRQDDKDTIQTIPSTGGTAKTLISSNDARVYYSNLAFAPDGKTLYYGKQENWQIISMIVDFE